MPPLRERKEDIPELVAYFMENFCRRYGKPEKKIQAAPMKRLNSYHWPGNVRELKNTVERLAIMVPGEKVTVSDLPSSILKQAPRIAKGTSMKWQEAREEFERQFLLDRLAENHGNISLTAASIGMERTHLHRKLKAYKIKVKELTAGR